MGSFAAFGYRKDRSDHHRLLVDDYAAGVVRDIFKWKLEGISAEDIADRLSESGILTPMDYKRSQGMRCSTAFRGKEESAWSAGMVLRILKKPVYTGVLEQGRVTTSSYKVKRPVQKPREESLLFPLTQCPQDFSDFPLLFSIKHFPPVFRREHYVVFAIPLRV